jgi:transposase
VHDRRRLEVKDLPTRGRPTTLVWLRRRFRCDECGERFWENHPEIILGCRTHITRRLARQVVRDVNHLSIREVCRRYDLPWHYVMRLVGRWSDLVVAARRRRRCKVLLVDEATGM